MHGNRRSQILNDEKKGHQVHSHIILNFHGKWGKKPKRYIFLPLLIEFSPKVVNIVKGLNLIWGKN